MTDLTWHHKDTAATAYVRALLENDLAKVQLTLAAGGNPIIQAWTLEVFSVDSGTKPIFSKQLSVVEAVPAVSIGIYHPKVPAGADALISLGHYRILLTHEEDLLIVELETLKAGYLVSDGPGAFKSELVASFHNSDLCADYDPGPSLSL